VYDEMIRGPVAYIDRILKGALPRDLPIQARPPGWEPHKIVTRIDGWVVDPENEDRIAAPSLG